MKTVTLTLFLLLACASLPAQVIRGSIRDAASGETIPFAFVRLIGEQAGVQTDEDGIFLLSGVSLGRHTIEVSCFGYESAIFKEISVTAAKETVLDVRLTESPEQLEAAVVRPQINKMQPLNRMVSVGGRMFSVEEAARYAGGFDDPARLATAFAGVSSGGTTNGISIHGNAPHLLLWCLEGVEIPNPNHFADISALGGGIFSSLSAQVIGNSDFLTSAFPAEYSNAVSGVFDIKLKTGNACTHEHTAQVGVAGIDLASEGPVNRKGGSYIVNYRYSLTGLVDQLGLIDMDGQSLHYQDLNFKVNLPAGKAGTFALWGTGLIDRYESFTPEEKRQYRKDYMQSCTRQWMFAGGLTHTLFLGKGTLKSTLATNYFKEDSGEEWWNEARTLSPYMNILHDYTNLIAKSAYTHKCSARLTAQAGIQYTQMFYAMNMDMAPGLGMTPLLQVYDGNGHSGLLKAYTSHSWRPSLAWTLHFGLNYQYLGLNGSQVLEPRLGIVWQPTDAMTVSAGYGLHSRAEKTDVYFVKIDDAYVNRNLGFTKAHHLMLSWGWKPAENWNLKVEPYYQYLFDVPVEAGTSYSVLNRVDFFLDKALENDGLGRNYGLDITLERYLAGGWYGMASASLLSSTYAGGDGIWHSTRYDRGYILNGLAGKEWEFQSGRRVFSVNLKATFQGGDRTSPVDLEATRADPSHTVRYDDTRAFEEQYPPMFILHYTIAYRLNTRHCTHEFSIKHINATGTPSYYGHEYNERTGMVEPGAFTLSLPNLAYKIEF